MVAIVKSFKADVSCVSPSSRNTACDQVLHSLRDHRKSFCFLRCALVKKLFLYFMRFYMRSFRLSRDVLHLRFFWLKEKVFLE